MCALGANMYKLGAYKYKFGAAPNFAYLSADLLERRACETSFIAAASQQQPASCS